MTNTTLADLFGPLDEAHLRGGCQTCNAYQTIVREGPLSWRITVHHDNWCPTLQAIQARRP